MGGSHSSRRRLCHLEHLSSILGFVALSLLLTATCFVLAKPKILLITILQGAAAFFAIFSLIAGAVDICIYLEVDDDSDCTERMRIETGAGFEIFACLLYIPAIISNALWYRQVCRDIPRPLFKMRSRRWSQNPPRFVPKKSTIASS
jgi:hypothetical protein